MSWKRREYKWRCFDPLDKIWILKQTILNPNFQQVEPCLKDLEDKNVRNSKGPQKNSSGILQNNFASYVGHPRICTSLLYPGPGPINTASSFAPSLRFHAKVGEIPATAVESHWLIGWYQWYRYNLYDITIFIYIYTYHWSHLISLRHLWFIQSYTIVMCVEFVCCSSPVLWLLTLCIIGLKKNTGCLFSIIEWLVFMWATKNF